MTEPTKIGQAKELADLQAFADSAMPGRFRVLTGDTSNAADPAVRTSPNFFVVQDLESRSIVCRSDDPAVVQDFIRGAAIPPISRS